MGKAEIVAILLAHGADALALDQDEWSPFIYALYSDSLPSTLVLIRQNENALLDNLTILGKSLIHREVDVKLQTVLHALATVPEFHQMLNNLIQRNPMLLNKNIMEEKDKNGSHDTSHGKLAFIEQFPFLLNLQNKLLLAYFQLEEISESGSVIEKFPILTSSISQIRLGLRRELAWVDLTAVLAGKREPDGSAGKDIPGFSADDKGRSMSAVRM